MGRHTTRRCKLHKTRRVRDVQPIRSVTYQKYLVCVANRSIIYKNLCTNHIERVLSPQLNKESISCGDVGAAVLRIARDIVTKCHAGRKFYLRIVTDNKISELRFPHFMARGWKDDLVPFAQLTDSVKSDLITRHVRGTRTPVTTNGVAQMNVAPTQSPFVSVYGPEMMTADKVNAFLHKMRGSSGQAVAIHVIGYHSRCVPINAAAYANGTTIINWAKSCDEHLFYGEIPLDLTLGTIYHKFDNTDHTMLWRWNVSNRFTAKHTDLIERKVRRG